MRAKTLKEKQTKEYNGKNGFFSKRTRKMLDLYDSLDFEQIKRKEISKNKNPSIRNRSASTKIKTSTNSKTNHQPPKNKNIKKPIENSRKSPTKPKEICSHRPNTLRNGTKEKNEKISKRNHAISSNSKEKNKLKGPECKRCQYKLL